MKNSKKYEKIRDFFFTFLFYFMKKSKKYEKIRDILFTFLSYKYPTKIMKFC